MMASGEIRLLPTTMRRMPVLAQSQGSGGQLAPITVTATSMLDPIFVTSQSTAPSWSSFASPGPGGLPVLNCISALNCDSFFSPLGSLGVTGRGLTLFQTAHYSERLIAAGVDVASAEAAVANGVASLQDSLSVGAPFSWRLAVDGVLLEYRAFPLPGGSVNVGTIFPVVP